MNINGTTIKNIPRQPKTDLFENFNRLLISLKPFLDHHSEFNSIARPVELNSRWTAVAETFLYKLFGEFSSLLFGNHRRVVKLTTVKSRPLA